MGFSFIFPQRLPAEEFLSSMRLRASKFGCVRVIEAITEALSLGARINYDYKPESVGFAYTKADINKLNIFHTTDGLCETYQVGEEV